MPELLLQEEDGGGWLRRIFGTGIVAGIAIVGGILAGPADARSVAKSAAGAVLAEEVVRRGSIAAVGARGATATLSIGVGFALSLCGDQGGACERQESEKVINERIAKEFPGAYTSPEYCFLGHWPCIEVFTGNERGPGYEEAREKVIPLLKEEAQKAREENRREAAKRPQVMPDPPSFYSREW